MESQHIKNSLERIFNKENQRIVFWYDGEGEFQDFIPSLNIDDVNIISISDTCSLELKIKLELEDKEGRYLIYTPSFEPKHEDDWLLDIKLYSYTFHADRASLILRELGLADESMKFYIKDRQKFFRNQERVNKLKKIISPNDNDEVIDSKMVSVLAKSEVTEIYSILMNIFDEYVSEDSFNPDHESKIIEEISKYGLEDSFWKSVTHAFGYINEKPKISDLLLKLLATDFVNNLGGDIPSSLDHLIIDDQVKSHNISVFMSRWRNDVKYHSNYNVVSNYYSPKLKIDELLMDKDLDQLIDVMTFESVERQIIKLFKDRVIQTEDISELLHNREDIKKRMDGYWARSDSEFNYNKVYEALRVAIELFSIRDKHENGFSYPKAKSMIKDYTAELYLFDQYYRLFNEYAYHIEMEGWDVLKDLEERVEDCYSNWFIDHLSITWDGFLGAENQDSLLKNWSISGIKNQYDFYDNYIKNILATSSRSRVFVIISDALRYEAADELKSEIVSMNRIKVEMEVMLGVLPSYTALGMASLLPHKSIKYKGNSSQITVDGNSSASLNKRSEILSDYKGIAVKADELIGMERDEGRNFIEPYKLIYIYHNHIDAIGDAASSESKTFMAVRETINELRSIVSFVVNSLNGSYVLITADHGFLYLNKTPQKIDRSTIEDTPKEVILSKKRYVIGKNLGKSKKVWSGITNITAKTDDDMEFWVPKGANRFHFKGGSKYFHGGATLQEITVPVLVIKEASGKDIKKTVVNKVGVTLIGNRRKIVTNKHNFEFIQTESVGDKLKPNVLKISIRDENELISNEEVVTFDSSSSSIEDRKKQVTFTLKSGDYDRKKDYFLVMRDVEDDIEYERISLSIDLAFSREF